ncbi:MAG: hypothetical protein NC131_14275 [Roseburia sp.]|nr:hypothetical protein [Roseburia sp.]
MPSKIVNISKFTSVQFWDKLSNNIDGLMIRCAYRGSSTGELTTDAKFKEHVNNAVLYNIPFGVYIYSQAIDEEEAIEEAHYVNDLIKSYHLSLPVFIQSSFSTPEAKGRADNLSANVRTNILIAFCNEMKALDHKSGIFISDEWAKLQLSIGKLNDYTIWVEKNSNEEPIYVGEYIGWQFTTNGYTPGIKGKSNVSYWYRNIKRDIPTVDNKPKIDKIENGNEVIMEKTDLYPTASSTIPDTIKTGLYYIWNDTVCQNKVRICSSKDKVNVPGMVTGWVKVNDILDVGETIPDENIIKIMSGNLIKLENARFYSSSTDKTAVSVESGDFYIWSSAIINNRIRICTSIDRVGVMGKVTAWIELEDL